MQSPITPRRRTKTVTGDSAPRLRDRQRIAAQSERVLSRLPAATIDICLGDLAATGYAFDIIPTGPSGIGIVAVRASARLKPVSASS